MHIPSPQPVSHGTMLELWLCYNNVMLLITDVRYPIISTTPHQRAKFILIAVVVLHTGLAVAIKILFFA